MSQRPPSEKPRRSNAPRPLAETVIQAALPWLGRRGLAEQSLLTHWTDILGPVLAARVHPVRLTKGVLHVKAESGGVALELQHRAPLVIDRINTFLGRPAVERLSVRQGRGYAKRAPRRPAPPPLPPERRAQIDKALESVDDPALREALGRLGHAIGRLQAGRGG
ncbi:DUF721 domain-containing protein [Pararhodospirillum photometricum]|uniref:DUF721 domain-containing protein n=1 Tax=Pararhodospirillum photometricum DSM 122 TaxID=1150469 RepID=H6SP27_PARPM|nr:DUF721 domain-containing protein [Pararhodospirillum photometricum]CCG07099.1 Putative uncharacterized protein [Pararhodospirillum photometricum DSM 122]